MPNQTVYLEAAGNAGYVSLNYDRKLNDHFTVRVGYGGWRSFRMPDWFFTDASHPSYYAQLKPVMLNYLARRSEASPNWLEVGAGFVFGKRWSDVQANKVSTVTVAGTFGYRFMERHAVFRIGLTPSRALSGDTQARGLRLGAGSSIGFSF